MCVDYYSGDIDPRGIVVVSGWHRHKIRIGFQAIDDTRKKKEKGNKVECVGLKELNQKLIWEQSSVSGGWQRHKIRIGFQAIEKSKKQSRVCYFEEFNH